MTSQPHHHPSSRWLQKWLTLKKWEGASCSSPRTAPPSKTLHEKKYIKYEWTVRVLYTHRRATHRPLADGTVHSAGSATYQIFLKIFLGYRSRILTRSLTLNLNPITDHNPNPNHKNKRKQNDTWIKFNIELYLKVNILGQGVGFIKGL